MSPDSPPITAESPDKSQLDRAPHPSTSTRIERSSLESLPDEVLINIIRNGEAENTPCVVWSVCLVSKRMEAVARQELYRAISIDTYRGLKSLSRTLKEKPELGQYMRQLKLIVPSNGLLPSNPFGIVEEEDLVLLSSLHFKVLKRSAGLRKLTVMLMDRGTNNRPTLRACRRFIHRLSEAIKRSQQSGSITAILPRLEQVRLINDAQSQYEVDRTIVHLEVFKPFLHLSSLSSIEAINDCGVWGNCDPSVQPTGSPTKALDNAHHYEQIKSVILRESDSYPTSIMDLVNSFPVLVTLFIQKRLDVGVGEGFAHRAETANMVQKKAGQVEKRCLSDSFEKLQSLNTLAFIPHSNEVGFTDFTRDFLGPSKFLSLRNLSNLTSISVLINVFASPDGSTTGHLTVSPMEVLPRSLRSLHIIVDVNSAQDFRSFDPLDEAWFQPRIAALGFMEELASICSNEFPSLRQVEYIWAVTPLTDMQRIHELHGIYPGDFVSPEDQDALDNMQPCDGTELLCCTMHTAIQALSPDTDYTSKAKGIVSPFRGRFDSLKLAFMNVGVNFEETKLKKYSDFFFHWQQGRK